MLACTLEMEAQPSVMCVVLGFGARTDLVEEVRAIQSRVNQLRLQRISRGCSSGLWVWGVMGFPPWLMMLEAGAGWRRREKHQALPGQSGKQVGQDVCTPVLLSPLFWCWCLGNRQGSCEETVEGWHTSNTSTWCRPALSSPARRTALGMQVHALSWVLKLNVSQNGSSGFDLKYTGAVWIQLCQFFF